MKQNKAGISLIEIVVVMGIFAVLGVLSTQALTLSLQGSRKGDNLIKVRENVDYALSVIERNIRNAESITSCTTSSILYKDSLGGDASFSCGSDYIASGSAELRLTSTEVKLTTCSFTCTPASGSVPPKVVIKIDAVDAATQGSKEGSTVSTTTEINLRTY